MALPIPLLLQLLRAQVASPAAWGCMPLSPCSVAGWCCSYLLCVQLTKGGGGHRQPARHRQSLLYCSWNGNSSSERGSQGLRNWGPKASFTPVCHKWPQLCSLPLCSFSQPLHIYLGELQIPFQVFSGKLRSELVLLLKMKGEKTTSLCLLADCKANDIWISFAFIYKITNLKDQSVGYIIKRPFSFKG